MMATESAVVDVMPVLAVSWTLYEPGYQRERKGSY
jgi:hypothetical protein